MKIGAKNSLIPRPAINALALVGQTYATTLIGLLIGIVSARGLTVGDRGYLALFLLLTQLLSRFGSLGFEQIIQRHGLKYPLRHFYLYAFIGSAVLGVFIIPFMDFFELNIFLVFVMCLTSFFVSILRINISILIHEEMIGKIFIINIFQAVIQLLLYVGIFNTRNVDYFLGAWIITVLAACFISIYILLKFVNLNSIIGKGKVGNLFYEGLHYFGVILPEMAISFCLELPLIRHTLGVQVAGLYSISNTMSSIYYQISVAISAVVAKGNLRLNRFIIYTLLAVIGFIFAGVSYFLLPILFGVRYMGALKFLFIILPSIWVMSILRIEQMSSKNSPSSTMQVFLSCILVCGFLVSSTLEKSLIVYGIAFTYIAYASLSFLVLRNSSGARG